LGNITVSILLDLLRGRAYAVEVPATFAGDECPKLALLTFNLGLEDRMLRWWYRWSNCR